MKAGRILGTAIIVVALIVATGGLLTGKPERDQSKSERMILPTKAELVNRINGMDEVVFSEDFENGIDDWTSSDQVLIGWHVSDYAGLEDNGNSWWCGDTLTGYADQTIGYDNMWMQWLETPALDLSDAGNNLTLTFDAKWLLEDPRRVPPPQGWDGWDGWLVMVSVNGGASYAPIQPVSPAYTAENLSAPERFHALPGEWPGWVFESDPDGMEGWEAANDTVIVPEWVECEFDLADYRRDNVKFRFILLTDRTVAAPFNFYLRNGSGIWLDNILISDGDGEVFLSNNGDDDPEPAELIAGHDLGFTETWELSDENVHTGNFSLWNDDDNFGVINAIDSPPFEVPEGLNTHFRFWVNCDLPDSVHGNSGALSDFYQVFASDDDGETWTYLIHDYNRPEAGGRNWVNYIPGTHWNVDVTNMELTDYAGSEIRLRWLFRVDNNHINSNNVERDGAGLFIDDIMVIAENRQPRDAGFDNVNVPYPLTVRARRTGLQATLYNYGSLDLSQIFAYWGWNDMNGHGREYRIIPNPSVLNGDSLVLNITDYIDRQNPGWTPNFPGRVAVYARTAVGSSTPQDMNDDDQNSANDSMAIGEIDVWPAGIAQLGYDNRRFRFTNRFDAGSGAAVRFSPAAAGMANYNIAFAHFRFNGNLEAPATFNLHVLGQGGDGNSPGNEILEFEVTVPPDSCLPGHMTVDLSNREQLRNLQGDFWLWVEVTGDDNNPQIVSNEQFVGEGRTYSFDGQGAEPFEGDLAIHASVIPASNIEPSLAESEQLVDFGEVVVGESTIRTIGLYSTNLNPVTIRSVRASNDAFDVDFPGETTLRTGQAIWFDVIFTAPDLEVHAADLIIESNDETPPSITIAGSGMVSVAGDPVAKPLQFGLAPAFPNPFNSTTRLGYSILTAGQARLAVYNLAGQLVATIFEGNANTGNHQFAFKADGLPTGVYIVKLESQGLVSTQKIILMR